MIMTVVRFKIKIGIQCIKIHKNQITKQLSNAEILVYLPHIYLKSNRWHNSNIVLL